jgi:hypothetical protein
MARPRKIKFPIKLEELLRLALPKKRLEDRFKYYRLILRDKIGWTISPQPTDELVEKEIVKARSIQYGEQDANYLINYIRYNVPVFEAEIRQKRAEIAAAKRWSKKKTS